MAAIVMLASLLLLRYRLHLRHTATHARLHRRYRTSRRGRAMQAMELLGKQVHSLASIAQQGATRARWDDLADLVQKAGPATVRMNGRAKQLGWHREELERRHPKKKRLHARPGRNSFWE